MCESEEEELRDLEHVLGYWDVAYVIVAKENVRHGPLEAYNKLSIRAAASVRLSRLVLRVKRR